MHVHSDDRRFMLLLACALLAVAILGVMAGSSLRDGEAAAAVAPVDRGGSVQTVRAENSVARIEAVGPQPLLQQFLTSRFEERFPELARAVRPRLSPLQDTLIVSYYGNPYSPNMGILGKADPQTIAARLEEQAARYDELNGPLRVMPAFHLVYAVAQPHPAADGRYLYYMDDADVREYVALAEERDALLFLDLQIGRSSVEAELQRVLPYLRYDNVHLALDPEFAVALGEVPGAIFGSLHADDINRAQTLLQQLVDTEHLPPKLLIVHQFVDSMVLEGDAIQRYPDVDLVLDVDGFGPAAVKRAIYGRYASRPYAYHAAVKLFFEQDPDLMSELDVLSLEPRPSIVIYQ